MIHAARPSFSQQRTARLTEEIKRWSICFSGMTGHFSFTVHCRPHSALQIAALTYDDRSCRPSKPRRHESSFLECFFFIPPQESTVSSTPRQADACRACARTAASAWTGLPAVSCASVHRGSTRNRTARWPPAVSPDSPSSPSEAWGRGSTSRCPSCKYTHSCLLTSAKKKNLCSQIWYCPWQKLEI